METARGITRRRRLTIPLAAGFVVLVSGGAFGQAGISPARSDAEDGQVGDLASHVQHLRFFEGDATASPAGEREYATEFEAARARYVWTELQFEHPAPGTAVEFTVECVYRSPDGSERGRLEMPFAVEPDWSGAVKANGWGNAEAGTWEEGRYTVSCTHEGRPVAHDAFRIVSGPPDLPSLGAKLMDVRFFEGNTDPGWGEREYATEFEAAAARYVYTELRWQLPERDRVVELPVGCLYIRSDGTLLGQVSLEFEIQPGWTRPQHAKGLGWSEPGNWTPGTYRVACVAEGRLLADRVFGVR